MNRLLFVNFIAFLVSTTSALAHPGLRTWIGIENGKITTFAGPYPPSDPADYEPDTGFAQPLVDEGGDLWDTDFPGFQKVPGGDIPVGTTINYNIVGPVLWFNSSDPARCPFFEPVFDAFASSPSIPQFAITNELFQTQYTSTGFVAGDAAFEYNGGDGDHNHLTYTLLGDGANPGGGLGGIYALQLQLTAPGFTPSDLFYLLLGKNVADENLEAAEDIALDPRIPPDLDCDGDVDLSDLADLLGCTAGPDSQPPNSNELHCAHADFNSDGHSDLVDFGAFQRCFATSGEAPGACEFYVRP